MPEALPRGGRCVLRAASKPRVRRGQLLLSAEPFVYLLKDACVRDRCCYCLERAVSLQRCSGCQVFYFCNRECQRKAWTEYHRFECRRLKAVAPRLPPDTALLLARLIVKLRRGGDRISERISDTRQRAFKDLMSHYKDIKATPARMEHVTSLAVVLRSFLGDDDFPNMCELTGMYGRICVNCFNILDGEMSPIAVGVYLAPSIIDHSCEPNAAATFSGRTIAIRALEDMPAFTWDKVRICYIDSLADRQSRRRELRAGYFFDCDCPRCTGTELTGLERALRCGTRDCPAPVVVPLPAADEGASANGHADGDTDEGRLRCPRCRYQDFSPDVRQQLEQLSQTAREIAQDNTVYYDSCVRCLERQRPLLHPMNVHWVKTLDLTLEAAISTAMWERALELGEQVEPGYKLYYGPFHPLLGVFYLKLGKIALHQYKHQLAARYLQRASEVLSVTHGPAHSLVRDTLGALLQQVHVETAAR